jgi:hypothetical protein
MRRINETAADFDRFQIAHPAVVAGLVRATPGVKLGASRIEVAGTSPATTP